MTDLHVPSNDPANSAAAPVSAPPDGGAGDPLANAVQGKLHEHQRRLLVTSRATAAAFFAVAGVVGALVLQRPELLAFSAPMMLALALAAVAPPWDALTVDLFASTGRAVEGDKAAFLLRLRAASNAELADVELSLPSHFEAQQSQRTVVPLTAGAEHLVTVPVDLVDFGVGSPDYLHVTTHGPFGFFLQRQSFSVELPVRILLSAERTRTLLSPRRYRNSAGSHLSGDRGEGCEIADLRPYQPGDRLKNINRRVSQRRGELWITERHPDRSSDLVLVFDNSDWIRKQDEETVRQGIRAVIGLSQQHLRSHDRVGVLQFGSKVRWVAPRLGRFQTQKIVDSLLELRASLRVRDPNADSAATSTLPPNAVMVAFTPLTSAGVRQSLIRYRRHGLTVTVVELQPSSLWTVPTDPDDRNAFRIFRLNHELVRKELRDMGVQVVPWTPEIPLEQLVRQVDLMTRAKRGGGVR